MGILKCQQCYCGAVKHCSVGEQVLEMWSWSCNVSLLCNLCVSQHQGYLQKPHLALEIIKQEVAGDGGNNLKGASNMFFLVLYSF